VFKSEEEDELFQELSAVEETNRWWMERKSQGPVHSAEKKSTAKKKQDELPKRKMLHRPNRKRVWTTEDKHEDLRVPPFQC
jgi:hypothetical protein